MEKAGFEKLHHVAVQQRLHQLGPHRAAGGIRGDLRELTPRHPLLRQHAPPGKAAEDVRNLDGAADHLRSRHIRLEPRRVVRLQPVVELLHEPFRGDVQDGDETLRGLHHLLEERVVTGGDSRGGLEEGPDDEQVQGDDGEDIRPLHLDGDDAAPSVGFRLVHARRVQPQRRLIHLPDGRGGDRLRERGRGVLEDVVERHPVAQARLDRRPRLVASEGRNLIEQLLELVQVGLGQEIGTDRDRLPNLDERGALLADQVAHRRRAFSRVRLDVSGRDVGEDG